jgi:hypothetical protein
MDVFPQPDPHAVAVEVFVHDIHIAELQLPSKLKGKAVSISGACTLDVRFDVDCVDDTSESALFHTRSSSSV